MKERRPAARWTEFCRFGALMAIVALAWTWHHDRWTLERWNLPTAYGGDAYEILARIQAASEGDTWPLTPQVIGRLGAPFGAHWDAYPTPDKLLMLALGGLAKLIGLFPAANLGLLLAQLLAAAAFYWTTTRWLKVRWEWAAAGALLFAYSYATFNRGLAHFSFLFSWTIPIGLLAVWLVGRSRVLNWKGRDGAVCAGAALALGAHNPYYLYFWLQLMGWAVVGQWYGARRKANLAIGVGSIIIGLTAFFATHAEYWLHQDEAGGRALLARNYGGTERYALKPVEMLIPPPTHRVDMLAQFGQRYGRWSEWRGEEFLPYLGVVGIAGFLWLSWLTARRVLCRRTIPGQAVAAGWLLAFASIGGITNILAFFTTMHEFRATNRLVVFLSAIVLVFVVVRLSRFSARWPVWSRTLAAVMVAGLGLMDQLPRGLSDEDRKAIESAVESDRLFAGRLEAELPVGAMVFQLPVLGFPEVSPPWRLSDYEHFRPYLATSTLRFSYGAAKFRARSRWQRELEADSVFSMVRRLEAHGFHALYFNRKGYENRADSVLAELTALGYERRIESTFGNQVAVFLNPMSEPVPPSADQPTFGRGWHPRGEDGVRWAFADGVLSYHNPHKGGHEYDFEFLLSSPRAQKIDLYRSGTLLISFHVGTDPAVCVVKGVRLDAGVNVLELKPSLEARREGEGRYRLRTFAIHRAQVRPQNGQSAVAAPMAPDGVRTAGPAVRVEAGLTEI